MGNEELARIEKHAQLHLDRAQSQWTGATKTALAWIVALIIVWTQSLEPRFGDVRRAQTSWEKVLEVRSQSYDESNLPDRHRKEIYLDKVEALNKNYVDAVNKQEIDLPFSIKFMCPPELTPTLWLALALGLVLYLFRTRREVFSLTARGLKLLQFDVKSTPVFVRAMVGTTAWWLAPPPVRPGKHVSAADIQDALRMMGRTRRKATFYVSACALALVAMEMRVFYIGFCITSYILGITSFNTTSRTGLWLSLGLVNVALVCASFLLLWRWFSPLTIRDELDSVTRPGVDRRSFLASLLQAAATVAAGAAVISLSTAEFSRLSGDAKEMDSPEPAPRARRKRKKGTNHYAAPDHEGMYWNKATGVVHMVSASCPRCVNGIRPERLLPIDPEAVPWTTLRGAVPGSPGITTSPALHVEANTASFLKFHKQHRSFLLEQHVVSMIDAGHASKACQLLARSLEVYGHRSGYADLRLCDLLAGLAVRYKDTDAMKVLFGTLDSMRTALHDKKSEQHSDDPGRFVSYLYRLAGNHHAVPRRRKLAHPRTGGKVSSAAKYKHTELLLAALDSRRAKWANPRSIWHRRWSDLSRPVQWSWSSGKSDGRSTIKIA